MENELIIGIDLGGTNIKGVLVNKENQILKEVHMKTSGDTEVAAGVEWKDQLQTALSSLTENALEIKCIGIAAPGLANKENTRIINMPERLPGLENFDLGSFLGYETFALNDAHAHLMTESTYGVGSGYQNIVLLTLGTGVGGAIMIDGKLYQGEIGRAGHLGHISISSSEKTGITGTPGSLEDSIGECTLEERSFGRYNSTERLLEAYRDGDPLASWVWLNALNNLARGLVSIINSLSPQLIILTGGITNAGDDLMHPLLEFLNVYEWRPGGIKTEIKVGSTGQFTGALGAAAFARIKLND